MGTMDDKPFFGIINSILRGSFGFSDQNRNRPPVNNFKNPIWSPDDEDDYDELDDELFRHGPSGPFGFHIFSGDALGMHKYFEQQMNEMLKAFQEFGFSGNFDHHFSEDNIFKPESILPPESHEPMKPLEVDPRERYLKPSYEKRDPSNSTDSDLDDRIRKHGIHQFFREPTEERLPSSNFFETTPHIPHNQPRTQFFGKSVISRTIRRPDGSVEHIRTEKQSDGSETEVVTRTIGDQSYTITKQKDKTGTLETKEELINLEENQLNEFENKWNRPSLGGILPDDSPQLPSLPGPERRPSLSDWFSKFFK